MQTFVSGGPVPEAGKPQQKREENASIYLPLGAFLKNSKT